MVEETSEAPKSFPEKLDQVELTPRQEELAEKAPEIRKLFQLSNYYLKDGYQIDGFSAKEANTEKEFNARHFQGIVERVGEVAPQFGEALDATLMKKSALCHDLGKIDAVRGIVKTEIYEPYRAYKEGTFVPDAQEQELFDYIDGLTGSQKNVLAHAFHTREELEKYRRRLERFERERTELGMAYGDQLALRDPVKFGKPFMRRLLQTKYEEICLEERIRPKSSFVEGTIEWKKIKTRAESNWVIDHQIVSAIFVKSLLIKERAREVDIFGLGEGLERKEREDRLLGTILEHANPPIFMLQTMAEQSMLYGSEELEGLLACAERVKDRWQYKQGKDYRACGFSSPEAWVLAMIDSSQYGEKNGSLFKIWNHVFVKNFFWPWVGDRRRRPFFHDAYNQLVGEGSSFMEARDQSEAIGQEWVVGLFDEVVGELGTVKAAVEKALKEANLPIAYDLSQKEGISEEEYQRYLREGFQDFVGLVKERGLTDSREIESFARELSLKSIEIINQVAKQSWRGELAA